MPTAPADLTLVQCIARVASLRGRVEYFERRYGEREDLRGTQVVLRILSLILEESARRLVSEERELTALGADPLSDVYRATVRAIVRSVNSLEEHVSLGLWSIAQPHGRDFDAFVPPFTRLARLIDDNTVLIYRPTEDPSRYALGRSFTADVINYIEPLDVDVAAQIRTLPDPVYLRYPAHGELDNLAHLMVGHELAHLALRLPLEGDVRAAAYTIFRDAYERVRRDQPGEALPPAEDPPRPGEPLRTFFRQSLGWFTELACDLLAVRMVGPTYFLALNEQLALHPWFYDGVEQYEDTHPAVAWRLALLNDEVDRYFAGLADALTDKRDQQLLAGCWREIERYRGRIPGWEERITGPRREIIDLGLDRVRAGAGEILKRAEYNVDQFQRDVCPIWEKLDHDIAPAERIFAREGRSLGQRLAPSPPADDVVPKPWSEPLDWRSIINVGWLHWLATDKDPDDAPLDAGLWLDRRRRRAGVASMLAGAVELSEIQRQAGSLQAELGAFVHDG